MVRNLTYPKSPNKNDVGQGPDYFSWLKLASVTVAQQVPNFYADLIKG